MVAWGSTKNGATLGIDVGTATYSGTQGWYAAPSIKFKNTERISDSVNKLSWSGSAWTDSSKSNIAITGTTSNKTLTNPTPTKVTLSYGETTTVTFNATFTGLEYPGTLTCTATATLKALPYLKPSEVTSLKAWRTSDTAGNTSWSNTIPTDGSAPYTQVFVELQTNDDTAGWVRKYTGAAITSYPLTGLTTDSRYRIRVCGSNSTGTGNWITSAWFHTTPKTPTGLSLTRSGTNIVAKWSPGSKYRGRYDLEYLENENGSWQTWGTALASATSASRTASTASSWRFRIRNTIVGNPTSASQTADLSGEWATSALITAVPASPTNALAVRVSDSQQRISWVNPSSPATAPVEKIQVERQNDYDTLPWGVIAEPNAVQQIDNTGTTPGHRYRYRVRAGNTGGWSAWSNLTEWVATTPTAVSKVTAVKSQNQIAMSWQNNCLWQTGVDIQDSPDGEALIPLTQTIGQTTSYLDTDAISASTHQYTLRALVAEVPTVDGTTIDLYSTPAQTQQIVQMGPPLAPTVTVSPSGVVDADQTDVYLNFAHNPVDSTPMLEANFRYKIVNHDDWTTSYGITSPHQINSILDNDHRFEFQAQTKGEDPAFGPWSDSVIVETGYAPITTITYPQDGGTAGQARFAANLSFSSQSPTDAPTQWNLFVLNENRETIWARNGIANANPDFEIAIPYTFPEGIYTIQAQGQSSNTLWSDLAESTFTVLYDKPPAPLVSSAAWDDSGQIAFDIQLPAPDLEVEVPAITSELWRMETDGVLTLVDSQPVADLTQIALVDRIPVVQAESRYLIRSISSMPSMSATEYLVTRNSQDRCWIFLNWGPDWTELAKLRLDPAIDVSPEVAKETILFEGRRAPVEFRGKASYKVLSLSGMVASDGVNEASRSEWRQWEAAIDAPAPVCYRDHLGRKLFVSLSVDRMAYSLAPHANISAKLTEVDYVE